MSYRIHPLLAVLSLFIPVQVQASPTLYLAIEAVSAEVPVLDVQYGDLNLDGVEEALLLTGSGCETGSCDWHLVGSIGPGAWGVLASGSGERTGLVETYPEGHVIRSDGVILSWDGVRLSPYHDLLATMGAPRGAQAGEARLLNRLTGGSHRAMDVRIHEVDPYMDGEIWQVAVLPETNIFGEQMFHLISPEQTIALSGTSIGRPWLYQDVVEDEIVLRVVSVTGNGFMVETLQ